MAKKKEMKFEELTQFLHNRDLGENIKSLQDVIDENLGQLDIDNINEAFISEEGCTVRIIFSDGYVFTNADNCRINAINNRLCVEWDIND